MTDTAGDDATSSSGDEDYMADISLFIPSDHQPKQRSLASKAKMQHQLPSPPADPKPKRPKGLSWQQQKRIDRERKQRDEDERTKASLEAAIPDTNLGFKMLRMMGYNPGTALGKDGSGRAEPVGLEIRRSRAGIGVEEEAARKERDMAEKVRRKEEEMVAEFGSRQKTQWRSRRVVADYRKAEAALAQLENREVVEPPKDENGEELKAGAEEEEEEVITEENLHDILVKLRDEYQYCLYCGYQYESADALATNCPGLSEDDH